MKATKQIIILLLFLSMISTTMMGSGVQSKGFNYRKISDSGDTVLLNKYTQLALKQASKKWDPKIIKANIDSAELICKKENIEIPPLLHLARAQYFYLIDDFINSSQEAKLALELAEKNNSNPKILTQIMIFLGSYSLRTGFIKESLEYFNSTIVLAQKTGLKSIIPLTYRALSNLYFTMGNTREYNKQLLKMIEASRKENDTTYLKNGYYLLGSSLTGENRNYRYADSLELQDYIVPDSLVFRDFEISLLKPMIPFLLYNHWLIWDGISIAKECMIRLS
jgi:tetratricopeptide (TPR) repeat protein